MRRKRQLLRTVSAVSISCVVLGGSWHGAKADTATQYRWGPRGEIGGYAGDSALTRGEVGLFFPFYQDGTSLVFGDLRGRFFEGDVQEGNLALGYRRMMANGRIFGGWIGYDGRSSFTGNYFDQISGGIEVLDPNWEFRLNGYLPLTDKKRVSSTTTVTGGGAGGPPSLSLVGSQLFMTSGTGVTTTSTVNELAMYGVDVEFGVRVPLGGNAAVSRNTTRGGLPKHDLRLYGGAYYFDHDDFAGEIAGVRARAEWRINDVFRDMPGSFAAFDVAYQYDDVRDGLFQAGFRLNMPLSRKRAAVQPDQYDALMTSFIQRDPNIVTELATSTTTTGSTIVTEPVNDLLTGTMLDQTIFIGPGDDLQAEIDAAGGNSHLVVTDGATFTGSFVLPDDVTFQGAGTDLAVIGRITGSMATFSESGATPTLDYFGTAPSGAPNLTVGNNNHVLGFNIVGGDPTVVTAERVSYVGYGPSNNDGIVGNGNVSNVVIRQTDISDTGDDGIDFRAGGDRITISDVTVNDAHGDGIALNLNNSAVTVMNVNIANSRDDGADITGTPGDSSVLNFGNVSIGGSGDTGIDILGGGGTFTFANTDITGSGNRGVSIGGGDAGVNFDAASSITHNSDGASVNVNGGTPNTGSLSFDGSIDTTAGLGLQFDNADGTYDFTGLVTLNGGDAGIDILGGSSGTFTFTDTTITDPTGTGINIDGGTANLNFGGTSTLSQGNNATAFNVNNHTGGTVNVMGGITATNGDGLQFNNADGTYDFNGPVTLSGGDAGIDILGGSSGTFTFSNTDITDPTGTAFNANTTNAIVNYTGGTISQNNAQPLIDLSGTTNSSYTFGPASILNATNGTGIQLNNVTGSVFTFAGPVTLNGGDAGIDIINSTTSAFEFSNTTITDPSGIAFNIANVTDSAISQTGPITQNNPASAVSIDGFTDSVIAFQDPITANTGAADGVSLTDIVRSTISIFGVDIDTTTGTGFTATGLADSSLSVGSSSIDTTNGQALNLGSTGGSDVTMSLSTVSSANSPTTGISIDNVQIANIVAQTVVIDNATTSGIDIADTGGTVFVGDLDINMPGASGIDITDSSGTFTFSDLSITDPGGTGIDIQGGTATVNVNGGTISNANNVTTVGVTNHTGGTVNIGAGINATNGDGLQFDNADGTYDFSGPVTLNGGDAGIDILGNSAGTFTFAGTTSITNPTGPGLNVENLDAGGVVNYNGSITNNNNVIYSIDTTAAGSQVNFNTNGGNALLSTDNPNGAVFIFDADGDITQTTPMTVTRPTFSSLFATDGDGIWTFNDLTIIDQMGLNGGVDVFGQNGTVNFNNLNITTDSAGTGDATTGFLGGGNNIMNVTGNSNINADGGGALVLININEINMTFGDLISTNNLTTQVGFAGDDGIDILNVGTGSLTVTGTTTVDNADGVGISVEGSGGTYTFEDIAISNIGLDGVIAGVASTNTGTVVINGGSIMNTGSNGLRFGSTVLGNSAIADVNNVTFTGIGTDTVDTANSTLSGSGNTAAAFSCDDNGGNTGAILFNGGVDSCP